MNTATRLMLTALLALPLLAACQKEEAVVATVAAIAYAGRYGRGPAERLSRALEKLQRVLGPLR